MTASPPVHKRFPLSTSIALLPSIIPIFLHGAVKTVHTAPWPHCPNKNVCSNRLSWPYDSPHSLILGGRLFQTCGTAAENVLSPKLLRVRLTTSVRVSAERSCLTRASATSWQSSARSSGVLPDKDRYRRHST